MKRTELLQEIRKMRFEGAYRNWTERRLPQEEAARLVGVGERTFRRYSAGYEDAGLPGLIDKRLAHVSPRRAPVEEGLAVTERYCSQPLGWNVKHFYAWYQRDGGGRRSTGGKNALQGAGLVATSQAAGGASLLPCTRTVARDAAAPRGQPA